MFSDKFIGKSINNCSINILEWGSKYSYRDWINTEIRDKIIIYPKLEVHYEKQTWSPSYAVILNLYVTTGHVYTFYNNRFFKTEQDALNYFKET